MLLTLLMLTAAVIILLLLVTQVILPLVQGTPFFPNFRKITPLKARVDMAAEELVETTEYVRLKEDLNEINRRKAELERKQ